MKPARIAALVAAVTIVGGVAYWRYGGAEKKDPLADVIVASVTTGNIVETVQANGTVRPTSLVAVGAQVSGRITALAAATGRSVKKGDLIASIDSLTQEDDLRTAEASLADAKAQKVQKQASLAYAEAALARQKTTLAQNATSRDAYESANANADVARAQIESLDAQITEAEVKVKTAEVSVDYTRITAPMDGVVLLTEVQEGQTVQSAPTIAVIGEIQRMRVRAEISEADSPKVHVGQRAEFTILGDPRRKWSGTVAVIDPAPDSIRSDPSILASASTASSSGTSTSSSAVYYYGYFDVPNADGTLKTYMTAQVTVVMGEVKNVVTGPTAALSAVANDGSRTVDVATDDGRIETRKVDVGLDDKIRFEAKSGLKPGDKVVVGRRSGVAKSTMPGPPGGGL
jgi:macrolide-specific efflux system membrane fusion protein